MEFHTLDQLPLNKSGFIIDLDLKNSTKRRLLDLGLIKGTKITPIFISPSGNPRAYSFRGSTIAIRKNDAKLIYIQ